MINMWQKNSTCVRSVLVSICGVIVGETYSVEVSDMAILATAMHCVPHDGFILAAASSIIPEVKLSVF
jgi:hypothetical protein